MEPRSANSQSSACKLVPPPKKTTSGKAQKNIPGRSRIPENSPSCIPHHTGSRTGSSLPLELWLRFWIPPWSVPLLFCGSAKLECAPLENAAETPSIHHFVPRESHRKRCKALHPCVQPGESRRESQECILAARSLPFATIPSFLRCRYYFLSQCKTGVRTAGNAAENPAIRHVVPPENPAARALQSTASMCGTSSAENLKSARLHRLSLERIVTWF